VCVCVNRKKEEEGEEERRCATPTRPPPLQLKRIYDVLNRHLSDGRQWICGAQLTVADFAVAPWFRTVPIGYTGSREFAQLDAYEHVAHYIKRFAQLPSVKRGSRVRSSMRLSNVLFFYSNDTAPTSRSIVSERMG
jgi:glutathione S-transferase